MALVTSHIAHEGVKRLGLYVWTPLRSVLCILGLKGAQKLNHAPPRAIAVFLGGCSMHHFHCKMLVLIWSESDESAWTLTRAHPRPSLSHLEVLIYGRVS